MDFNDTPEEAAYRAKAQAFLNKVVKPKSEDTGAGLQRTLTDKEYLAAAKAYQKAKAEAGFAGITWGKDVFLEYIKEPKAKIPGTKMVFAGIKNEKEANDLWAYVSSFDKDGKTK